MATLCPSNSALQTYLATNTSSIASGHPWGEGVGEEGEVMIVDSQLSNEFIHSVVTLTSKLTCHLANRIAALCLLIRSVAVEMASRSGYELNEVWEHKHASELTL